MAFYKNNANGTVDKMLLASSPTNIYRWTGSQWLSIKSELTGGRFSFINYQQGMTEITIMGNGTDPMLKWDGVSMSDLEGNPPKASSITLHYERVWTTGDPDNPNTVRASKDMAPEFWDFTDPNGDDPLAVASNNGNAYMGWWL